MTARKGKEMPPSTYVFPVDLVPAESEGAVFDAFRAETKTNHADPFDEREGLDQLKKNEADFFDLMSKVRDMKSVPDKR